MILLAAANLDLPEKGLADIATAFGLLARENANWRLILAGRLRSLPNVLAEVVDRVTTTGLISDRETLAETYAAADVLAVPSFGRDQMPCTISEALACGTPVVAYDVAAISEMFTAAHGRLVPLHDQTALARAIRDVVTASTPETRKATREFAVGKYGAVNVMNRYEDVYAAATAQWAAHALN